MFIADTFWNYPSKPLPNYFTELDEYKSSLVSQNKNDFSLSLLVAELEVPVPIGSRLWKFGMDRIYLPFYRRFMVGRGERRKQYERLVGTIIDEWRPEAILPCHGDVVLGEELCRSVLKKHFQV